MQRKLFRVFAIDSRSLAAFRIAVGTILLCDLAIRSGDFVAHYTESGVAPLAAVEQTLGPASYRWSLYSLLAPSWWPALLMGLTAICGLLLVVGLATRISTVTAWALTLSLHNRMPLVINAGDTLLHLLLFWSLFLPLGATWSIDAWRRRRKQKVNVPQTVCSVASAAILLQLVLMYVCAGLFKVFNGDWWEGTSLYYVMSFDAYARPAAGWMLQHLGILRFLTWATVLLEIGAPLAALLPWQTAKIRLAVIASFLLFHAGIEATMTVGQFSWVSMAGWLLFVPPGVWTRFACLFPRDVSPLTGSEEKVASSRDLAAASHRVLPRPMRMVMGSLVFALLSMTVYWNATGFRSQHGKLRPKWARPIMEWTGLKQQWRMFTRPPKNDGWPRVVAKLTDGSEWDLIEDESGFDWTRRELPSAIAPNHRWRKYYNNLIGSRFKHQRPYFCRYLARRFQEQHSLAIESIVLYKVEEVTGPPGTEDRYIRQLLHRERVSTQGAFLDAAAEALSESAEIHPGI